MNGRFLRGADAAGLRAEATQAAEQGVGAVFLSQGTLGDPIVLAAGLSSSVPGLLLGIRMALGPAERHPAVLARDVASLDLVCGGRSVLCFAPPFDAALEEAVSLCRALWQAGELHSDGPRFPVRAAANRVRPAGDHSPLVAFDLTGGDELPAAVAEGGDMVLRADGDDPEACRLERV